VTFGTRHWIPRNISTNFNKRDTTHHLLSTYRRIRNALRICSTYEYLYVYAALGKNGFVQLIYDRFCFCRAFQMLPGEPNLNLIQTWKWHDIALYIALYCRYAKYNCDRLPSNPQWVPQPAVRHWTLYLDSE